MPPAKNKQVFYQSISMILSEPFRLIKVNGRSTIDTIVFIVRLENYRPIFLKFLLRMVNLVKKSGETSQCIVSFTG